MPNLFHPCKIVKVVLLFFVLSSLLLSGCRTEENELYDELWTEENSLYTLAGTWATEYDKFIIDLDTQTIEYDDGGWGMGYSGIILEIRKFRENGSAGVILIEYITKPTDYATEAPPEGNFTGIYFKDVSGSTGQFSSPTEIINGKVVTAARTSAADSKKTFSGDAAGSFVSIWSTYTK